MRQRLFFIAVFILLIPLTASFAYAGCPCSPAGQRDYRTTAARYEFCNGTNWISMADAGTLGACGTAAVFEYNTTAVNYEFRNGADRIPVANAGTLGGCASTRAIEYDTTLNTYKWCNGTNWINMSNEARGLLAHWKLDESSGTTAADSAGSNTGTLSNGPVWRIHRRRNAGRS